MLSLCSKAGHPFSMKQHHPCHFQAHRRREQCCSRLQSPPSCHPKTKKVRRQTHTHTQTHSKFKFQIQIAQNRTRGSERCDNEAAVVSKAHHLAIQNKKARRQTHTHTHTHTPKIRSDQHIQNSNFRFKSRGKRTRGSERCEKDRTAITIRNTVMNAEKSKKQVSPFSQ
jgi:hypothetical protein